MKLFKYFFYWYFLTKDSDQTYEDQAIAASWLLSASLTMNLITTTGFINRTFLTNFEISYYVVLPFIVILYIIVYFLFLTDDKIKIMRKESENYSGKIWNMRISVWTYVVASFLLLLKYV